MKPRMLVKQLRQLYRMLVKSWNASLEDRNKILVSALAVMDAVVRLSIVQHKNQLPPDASKLFDIAGKCRARAMGTPSMNEKYVSLRMALLRLEKLIAVYKPPALQQFLDKVDNKEKLHEERQKAKAVAKATGTKVPRKPRQPVGPQPANQFGVRRKFSPCPQIVPAGSPLIITMTQLTHLPFRASSAKAKGFQFWWEAFRTKEEVAQFLQAATNGKGKSLVWLLWNKRNGGDETMHWSFIQQGDKYKLVVVDPAKLPKP